MIDKINEMNLIEKIELILKIEKILIKKGVNKWKYMSAYGIFG